jgi:TP901-1 family phage major tail protein
MASYAGRQVLVKVDLNNVGGSGATNWTQVGQQRDGGITRSSETADATHKDDLGYPSAVITRTPWSVTCDGALNPIDSVLSFLKAKWKAKAMVWVQVDASAISGEKVEGQAIITDFSFGFPEGDLVSYTCEFQGDGALSDSP